MTTNICSVFVYGTLQRGEERERMWPCTPQSIEWATSRGRLYDLGSYPAMVDGEDLIRGELWHFQSADMAETLDVLDEIEGFDQGGDDLFIRRVISVRNASDTSINSFTYFFANSDVIANFPVVEPDAAGLCHWHRYLTSS